MAEKYLNLLKKDNLHIQEAQWIANRINAKISVNDSYSGNVVGQRQRENHKSNKKKKSLLLTKEAYNINIWFLNKNNKGQTPMR